MPAITIQPLKRPSGQTLTPDNPLPQLIQTPSGLALLELQGTFETSSSDDHDDPAYDTEHGTEHGAEHGAEIEDLGVLSYDPEDPESKLELLVGEHQRLTGSIQKLARPLAVLQKIDAEELQQLKQQEQQHGNGEAGGEVGDEKREEELRVVEIVRYKIVFAGRPEPVGAVVPDEDHDETPGPELNVSG